ncbi:Topoisomerase 1-associated factor 1 [Hondaea fermentalgiana]|uniref:Topoisomerase 1-associated factor 1 n=1 Tax=Hondaea fermentalgiana TaxID=2315210 RepID=A0A2R5GTW1_9STRA|nr:Topoisomerase 1-associated factor 1 [Hondaea fermentalgiana]|eukprot:GBG33759.1 Topoisomerase 1-associated factor 1 [Hondaea fermentalgiana]
MASKMLLGRRRREIATRKEVFLDLLSWRNEFKTLMKRLDGRLGSKMLGHTHQLRERFENGFEPSLTSRDPDRVPGNGKVDEDRFLNSFANILCRSGYHLVSHAEWSYAKENSYSFSIPTRVKWKALDSKLVQNVANKLYQDPAWATSGNNAKGKVEMPKEANSALVFHRGVGMDRTTRLFYGEKMDEGIRRSALFMYQIFHRQFTKFSVAVARRLREIQKASMERSADLLGDSSSNFVAQTARVARAVQRGTLGVLDRMLRMRISQLSAPEQKKVDVAVQLPSAPVDDQAPGAHAGAAANIENVRANHPAAADISVAANPVTSMQRASSSSDAGDQSGSGPSAVKDAALEHAMAARITLAEKALNPWNFLTYMTLQEVTYKDMVVIYRIASPAEPKVIGVDTAMSFRRNQRDLVNQYANRTNIHIRQYRDVPMADIELLFPEKQVYMSVMDRLRFGVMSVIGVAVMVPVLADDFVASPAWVAGVVASSSYLLRVLSRMYMSWAYYSSLTNAFFTDNIVASGSATIGYAGLDALDQATKEASVVYLALVELHQDGFGAPASMDAIVAQCKNVFEQKYPHNMHMFDPRPALTDLEDLGLVKTTGPGYFVLVSGSDDTRALLQEKARSDADTASPDSLELLGPENVPPRPSPPAPIATPPAMHGEDKAYCMNLCTGLGAFSIDPKGRRVFVRNDETCLKSLKRLRKELNEDTRVDKNHTALLLGELRIFRNFLIPLAKSCTHERHDKFLIEAAKVAVQLTMPVGSADKKESRSKRIYHLQQFKYDLMRPGALHAFLRLVEQPIANSTQTNSAQKKEDRLIVELMLWFLRNLVAVPDMAPSQSGSLRDAHLLTLHEDFVIMLQKESVIDMVLFLGEYVGMENNRDWNFILLEIFYQIFRGAEAEDLINPASEGAGKTKTSVAADTAVSSSSSTAPTDTGGISAASAASADRLKSLHLKMRAKRVQANKTLSTRHSRFGGNIKVTGTGMGQGVVRSAFGLTGGAHSSASGALGAKTGVRTKTQRRDKDAADQLANDVHVIGNDVRATTASRRLRRVQRDLCTEVIARCYGPLFRALKQDFRREDQRVLPTDHYQFVWLAGFCMGFERRRLETQGGLEDVVWQKSPLLATMDAWTFQFLISSCEQHESNKRPRELQNCLRMLSAMVQLLETMLQEREGEDGEAGEDNADRAFCKRLRNSVFYTSFQWELVPRYMRQWDPSTSSWLNMAHMAALSASMLQIMSQMDEEHVVVRRKRRGARALVPGADGQQGGKKKTRSAAARLMGKAWSAEETMALAEAVKDIEANVGSSGVNVAAFRKTLKDDALGPIFGATRTPAMLLHRWRHMEAVMKTHSLASVDAFLEHEEANGTGEDDEDEDDEAAAQAQRDEEERMLAEHRARLLAQDNEREMQVDSIVRLFNTNGILENLSVLIDPARVPGSASEAQLHYLQDKVVPKFFGEAARFNNSPALWHVTLFSVYSRALREYSASRPNLCKTLRTIVAEFFAHASSNPLAFAEVLFWRTKGENEQMLWHYENPDDRRARIRDERRRLREEEEDRRREERRQKKLAKEKRREERRRALYNSDNDDDDEDGFESYEEDEEVEEEASTDEEGKRAIRKVTKTVRKRRRIKSAARRGRKVAENDLEASSSSSSESEMEADLDNVGFSGIVKRRKTAQNERNPLATTAWSAEERKQVMASFADLSRAFPDSVYKMLACEAALQQAGRSEDEIEALVRRLRLEDDEFEAAVRGEEPTDEESVAASAGWIEGSVRRAMLEVVNKGQEAALAWIEAVIAADSCVLIPEKAEHYAWMEMCEELLRKLGWRLQCHFWHIAPAELAVVREKLPATLAEVRKAPRAQNSLIEIDKISFDRAMAKFDMEQVRAAAAEATTSATMDLLP